MMTERHNLWKWAWEDGGVTCCCTVSITSRRLQWVYKQLLVSHIFFFSEIKLFSLNMKTTAGENLSNCAWHLWTIAELKYEQQSFIAQEGKWDFKLISKCATQLWEYPSVFLHDVNLFQGLLILFNQSTKLTKRQPLVSCTRYLARHTHTHLTHDLDVRGPLSSSFAPLVRQNRQDKVSRFGQRLSDQEGPRLVSCTQQLLCVWPGQVTVVPPETQRHRCFTLCVHISTDIMPWLSYRGFACGDGSLM